MKKVFVLDTKVLLHNADAISSFSDIIVLDEAQNLIPHDVKNISSRASEGTKIVLTGYPCQINNPCSTHAAIDWPIPLNGSRIIRFTAM